MAAHPRGARRASRATLTGVRTVVVDEIHALARDKRGSHFSLSLERLKTLCVTPPQLIGLSATTRPLDRLAHFLVGAPRDGRPPCEVVQVGHVRPWELWLETPEDELGAAPTHEMWGQVYDRLGELSKQHRTMLVFSNTRRLAERGLPPAALDRVVCPIGGGAGLPRGKSPGTIAVAVAAEILARRERAGAGAVTDAPPAAA